MSEREYLDNTLAKLEEDLKQKIEYVTYCNMRAREIEFEIIDIKNLIAELKEFKKVKELI